MNCLFAYRKPESSIIQAASSHRFIQGLHPGCFSIGAFDRNPHSLISIPADKPVEVSEINRFIVDNKLKENVECVNKLYSFPSISTSRTEHTENVINIIDEIKKGNIQKCVSTRAIIRNLKIDVAATFIKLCETYPNAFVFLFDTPLSGTWIGASPELLLSRKDSEVTTMSLAGTKPSDSQNIWTQKEYYEQQIVTDFLKNILEQHAIKIRCEGPYTKVAGPVEHLMTIIRGDINSDIDINKLLNQIYPTPALAGFPREKSLKLIKSIEKFERGYYGGFCGWIENNNDFDLYVNLRSMLVNSDRYCIFAGGGIVEDSLPENEWQETENKSETLTKVITFA